MPSPELIPEGIPEAVAVAMLRHLEWQADRFSVVFLFADVGPALTLLEWLQRRLSMQGMLLQQRNAPDSFVDAPEVWLDLLLSELPDLAAQPGSLWAFLHRHPADQRWQRARRRFMARINERRWLLEQHFPHPLVLVLPRPFRSDAREMAPDLWHVRSFSHELAAVRSVKRGAAATASIADLPAELPQEPGVGYQEWQRMCSMADPARLDLSVASLAVQGLLRSGRPADALEVALQAQSEARRRSTAAAPQIGPLAWRERMMASGNVGDVARAQGDWAQAESAYRESLEISRRLVDRLGGTPESLDDLAVALLRNAELPGTDQQTLLSEARAIFERLAEVLPTVARYRDALVAMHADLGPQQLPQ